MDADETSTEVPAEVSKAIGGVEKSMMKLIKLLASPDEAVQAGALAVLDGLGVVSIGYLAMGLQARGETAYRVRIVEALGTLAPVSRTTVLLVLGLAAQDGDAEVRMAAAQVVWALRPYQATKSPKRTPAGA